VEELGGTMRLGAWTCKIEPGTLAHKVYGKSEISERTVTAMSSTASTRSHWSPRECAISGSTPDGTYVEMIELPDHRISSDASFIRNSNRSAGAPSVVSGVYWSSICATGWEGDHGAKPARWKCSTAPKK